jgi:hypothetical protein
MWFNLYAFHETSFDRAAGVNFHRRRIELEKKMTPSQIEKAQEMARNWKPKK